MKIQSKTLGIAALVLAGVALCALGIAALIAFSSGGFIFADGPGVGAAVEESKSFPLEGITKIRLGTGSTDVLIVRSQDSTVSVRLHGSIAGSGMDSIPTLAAGLSGGELTARVERNRVITLGFHRETLVLEVGIPAAYTGDIEADIQSGDVTVRDQRPGDFKVSTGSGDVRLERISGVSLLAKTSSGDLTANEVEAKKTELSTSSGDISVRDLVGDLYAHSSSGDISVSFAAGPGSSSISSSSGDVGVLLPSSAEFSLDVRTRSGDISCGFPITVSGGGKGRRSLIGAVGNAAAGSLSVESGSGDVKVNRR